MITLSFDKHDFLFAVEGFARGSHLRQHVWEDVVFRNIPQMSDDEMDYLWFYMRRDLWDSYFYEINGKTLTHVGHEDFLHALAALHRGNRYEVTFVCEGEKKKHTALCYRFDGEYRPLSCDNGEERGRFNSFIPDKWIKTAKHLPEPINRYLEWGKEAWWDNVEVYAEKGHTPVGEKRGKTVVEEARDGLNALAQAVNQQLFEGCRDWYWVGDHIGGICCFEDTDYLNTEDMVLIVERKIDYNTYAEWRDAEIDHPKQHINLMSWIMGARYETNN